VIVDFVMLADAAASANRKLYIHGGGLRRIDAPALPFVCPISVVARFTADLDEAGDAHALKVRLISPADEVLFELGGLPVIVPKEPPEVGPDWEEISAAVTLGFAAVVFREEGWHVFSVELDDEPLADLRLRIVVDPGQTLNLS
jgi:hypothetical protein